MKRPLQEELSGCVGEVHAVGDVVAPSNIESAVTRGLTAGRSI